MLQSVAERLRDCVRGSDTVARLGGDEFVVLAEGIGEPQSVVAIASKLLESLRRPHTVSGQVLFVSASIGISCCPEDGGDAQALLSGADAAMYDVKQQGRNSYGFFSSEMNSAALENLLLSNSLRLALERDELFLHYQPVVDLASGAICGVEALIRWHHPQRGLVSPAQLIPLAEENGMIGAIGDWVLKTACEQARAWQISGFALRVSVNLSARQFRDGNLGQSIKAVLSETGFDPQCLELEITESMMMLDHRRAADTLAGLREIGVTIAVDDFGTGYSSLSYLKNFPINRLKIDRSFVSDIPHDMNDSAIVRAIINMAKSLSLCVTAEGVETPAQRGFLEREGCDEMQGYLFSKPLTAEDMEQLLRQHRKRIVR